MQYFLLLIFLATLVGCENPFGRSRIDPGFHPGSHCLNVPEGINHWWSFDSFSAKEVKDLRGSNPLRFSGSASTVTGKVKGGWNFSSSDNSLIGNVTTSNTSSGLSVVAWAKLGNQARLPKAYPFATQWRPFVAGFNSFNAYQSGAIGSMTGDNFNAAAFDGRYLYLVAGNFTGKIFRLDTQTAFDAENSWQAFDASYLASGFSGGSFDGRYVYFVPMRDNVAGAGYHGRVVRYDTQGSFGSAQSWSSYDASSTSALETVGYSGATFDGRYLYFSPGQTATEYHGNVLRYDTQAEFKTGASWVAYPAGNIGGFTTKGFQGAVFDGRYVYFIPFLNNSGGGGTIAPHGVFLRYDTSADFSTASSWTAYDSSLTKDVNTAAGTLTTTGYYGGTFDGRYLYFAPHTNSGGYHGNVLRYDTRADFVAPTSWEATNIGSLLGGTEGYRGAIFDGRFVYFSPFSNAAGLQGRVVRYDTQASFAGGSGWLAVDQSSTDGIDTKGLKMGAFDGRNIYFLSSSRTALMKYDAVGELGTFSLEFGGANYQTGMGAYLPGLHFRINTTEGVRAVSSHASFSEGWHLVAATYDTSVLTLYIDGSVVASQGATGNLVSSATSLALGSLSQTALQLLGQLDEVQIFGRGLSSKEVQSIYAAGSEGLCHDINTFE